METHLEQLQMALQIARSAYWEYDVANDTFIFNNQFYSILGTTADKEGGYTMKSANYAARFVHPGDLAVVGVEIRKALESADPHYRAELVHRVVFADGNVGNMAVHIRIVKDATGRTVRTYGVNVDVTVLKRAEDSLKQTVSLLQSTFDSIEDGVLVVDPVGRITSYNKRFVALWRIPEGVLASREDGTVLNHVLGQLEHPEEFMRKVLELYADPAAASSDVLDFKDGRVFERNSRAQILDGAPVGRVWSFRDVTERVVLEGQLRQSQKMEAFGQLAAGIAHDFNNILTVIQGNASLLGLVELSVDEQDAAHLEIVVAAERAAKLTRQLLTFSRLHKLHTKDLDLNETVSNMMNMLQRLLGADIAQETHFAPGGAWVHADPGMMEQVLMNLVVNSRDSMPKGGRLSIRTTNASLSRDHARRSSRARPGEFVCLSVSDTGTGISERDLPHIFEPFFTTKDVGKGTGLGLATVYGVVEQHKGWIEVESSPRAGTTFNIFLDRVAGKAASGAAAEAPPKALRGTETILLVEDEDSVLKLMKSLMERYGYAVRTARSGLVALEEWSEHRETIDILVTDMVMPDGIGGRELARRLRLSNPTLKVIYCSGYSNEVNGEECPLAGNENFLQKPFQLDALLQMVRGCLDARA